MKVLILNHRDVRALLPMGECMEVMEEALKTAARGGAVNPLRTALRFPDGTGLLGMMPAYLHAPKSTGLKVVSVMPGNHATDYDSHQGAVMLFDVEYGRPQAIMDASSITEIRTAAVSGVATRLLARNNAATLAILGCGVQASSHLEAMRRVRPVDRVRVWSRSRENARRFAAREGERHGVAIEVTGSAHEAVAGADIICTTTAAAEPILEGSWLQAGVHINAVGACVPSFRELDTEAVVRSRLFIDRRESTMNESGDFLIPKREGAVDDSHIIGEIGELLLARIEGRRSDGDITLFKSLGIGVEDLAAAHYLFEKAVRSKTGVSVEFGATKHEAH